MSALTLSQERERRGDGGRTHTVKSVEKRDGFYSISTTDSTGFSLSAEYGVEPKPGDVVALYTHQGSMIHGVDVNGEPVFYRTVAEQEEERERLRSERQRDLDETFELERDRLDAAFDGLPEVFKRRIAWFRAHNRRFRQDYESYEMASCVDAVKLAAWAQEEAAPPEAIKRFENLSYAEQRLAVPALDFDRHSSNSFGFAVRLAFHYVTYPENVYREHGAMVPLVGCEEYGCWHPREEAT